MLEYHATGSATHFAHSRGEGAMSEQASLIQQFINYLQAERHFSPHTSKCYAADLAQFVQHLSRTNGNANAAHALSPTGEEVNRKLLGVDTDRVRDFLGNLRDKN